MEGLVNTGFYKGKKILITGHTGFKGAWLTKTLLSFGADIIGYSLSSPTVPNLYTLSNIDLDIESIIADIRDRDSLVKTLKDRQPEIVFHLAAQPIVRQSYQDPVYTYETNVMGTVNLLEAIRLTDSVRSFLNVTTDKVYKNNEWPWGYRENEALDGYDPYSNSKSCAELVTNSYKNSFFNERDIAISTARAGNVIGGGDFASDRIIPDCIRAISLKEDIVVRNPYSTRPYQHVLEPVFAYLMIAEKQFVNKQIQGCYNVGPDDCDCVTTGDLVSLFCEKWGGDATWVEKYDGGPHEANFLKLDCSKLKSTFGWKPQWRIEQAIEKTIEFAKCYLLQSDSVACMENQIQEYQNEWSKKYV